MNKLFLIGIIFIFFLKFSYAQNPEWSSFSNTDIINCIADDGSDTLWVGTRGGLVRLEKSTKKPHFFISSHKGVLLGEITSMVIDKQGKKVIGTKNGSIVRYDKGVLEVLHPMTHNAGIFPVIAMAVDKANNIWAAFSSGLHKYNGSSWTSYKPTEYQYFNSLALDSLDVPYISTATDIFKLNGTTFESLEPIFGSSSNNYTSLLFDNSGNLWVSSSPGNGGNGAVIKLIGTTKQIFQGQFMNDYKKIIKDHTGKIWVMGGSGYMSFNGTTFETGPYLYDNIRNIFVDSQNTLWLGTLNGLYHYLNPSSTTRISFNLKNSGIHACSVSAMAQDKDGKMWFASVEPYANSAHALNRLDTSWRTYNSNNSNPINASINQILPYKNNQLLLATEKGLCLFENNLWTYNYLNTTQYENYLGVVVDSKGNIFATRQSGGVSKYDGTSWVQYGTHNSNIPSNNVREMVIDKNDHVWVATDYGLAEYNGSKWIKHGTFYEDCSSIAIDKAGNKWLSNGGNGLMRFDGSSFFKYTTSNSSLPSNNVYALEADFSGNIWACMDLGLAKFDGSSWTVYPMKDSDLPWNSFNILIDKDQNKWLSADNGVVVFREGGVKWPLQKTPFVENPLSFNKANGGEIVTACTNYPIEFNILSSGSKGVRLYFSSDSGSTWVPLFDKITAKGKFLAYSWLVPAINSTKCLFKLVDLENPSISATSYNTFTIQYSGSKSIKLTGPSSTVYKMGENIPITWTSTNVSNVTIQYSMDNGSYWTTIVNGIENTGSYIWPAPGIMLNNCILKISDNSESCVYDIGKETYSIQTSPYLTITTLSNGETVSVGNKYNIDWSSGNFISEFVNIEFSHDNGVKWSVIAGNEANDGSYLWTAPDQVSNQCLFRVTAVSVPAISDVSNKPFSIVKGTITVTYPSEGASINTCNSFYISWSDVASNDQFQLYYSIDNGATWVFIDGAMSNTYLWPPAFSKSTPCLIKIVDAFNPTIVGISKQFTISNNPPFAITYPNGGEILEAGTQQTITWSKTGGTTKVRLYYSLDKGVTWKQIASFLNNNGSFTWTVPSEFSSSALIRINDFYNACTSDEGDATFSIASPNVWPGDNNNSGTVDIIDLLSLGLHFGASGSPRDSTSIRWMGHNSIDWTQTQVNNINVKYADADGNGIVNKEDKNAILVNYGKVQNVPDPLSENTLAVGTDFKLLLSKSGYLPGETVKAELLAGDQANPIADLYGVAFKLGFNAGVVQSGSFLVRYDDSFLATTSDTMNLTKTFPVSNELHGSLVRTNHIGISGYGKIADIEFTIDPIFNGESFTINLLEVKGVNANGAGVTFSTTNNTVQINIITAIQNSNNKFISIYPNPTNSLIAINSTNGVKNIDRVSIVDLLGVEHPLEGNLTQQGIIINLGNWNKGISFVKVYCGGNVYFEKILVE